MTTIPESLIEKIPEMDLGQLWEHFNLLDPDKKTINKVKKGIKAMFDIRAIIRRFYEEFPKVNLVRIDGVGEMDLYDFLDEIDDRKDIMLRFIYDNYNKDVTQGRVEE